MKFKIIIFLILSYHSTTIYAGGADVFTYQEGKIITLFPDTRHQDKTSKIRDKKTSTKKILTSMSKTKNHSPSITTEVISD